MKIGKLLFSTLLIFSALVSHALEIKPYSTAALVQAQKANQAVALHFHADWCPTCLAQEKVLRDLQSEAGLNITVLVANYDTEKDLKRSFNVRTQSTLLVFHGEKETYRAVGEATPARILAALKSAL